MSNLNFKWGNHAGLPKSLAAQDVGALFFTKDEGALYLGVESGKAPRRIQGTVQYYADLTQFKSNVLPPYSADVIYYIASENALVKWSGDKVAADGTVKSGEFVVLNVTAAEFTSTVTTLNQDIAANTGNISTLSGKLGETTAAAGTTTAFGRIKTLEDAVDALEAFTGIGGTTGSSLTDRVAALETWQGTMNTWKESISSTVADNTQDIATNTSNISINSQAIATKASQNDLDTLAGRVTTAEGTIVTHTNNIKDINDRIGTSADGVSKATVYGAIAQVKADLATEESARSVLEGRVDTAEQKLATAESDISGLKTRADNIESKNNTQDTAIQTAQSKADSAYNQAQTNKSDINDLISNLSNYYNKTEVNTIQENLSKAIEDAENGIRDDLNQHIKAANALKYQGGVTATTWPNIKNATAEIGDTYVVTDTIGSFDINNVTTTCHAGDMLIATGSENSEGKIPGNDIIWVHVASGYQREMQGVLSLEDADGSSAAKKVKVALTSLNGLGTNGDLGSFTIESASNNLEITTVTGGMKVQMVWDTF